MTPRTIWATSIVIVSPFPRVKGRWPMLRRRARCSAARPSSDRMQPCLSSRRELQRPRVLSIPSLSAKPRIRLRSLSRPFVSTILRGSGGSCDPPFPSLPPAGVDQYGDRYCQLEGLKGEADVIHFHPRPLRSTSLTVWAGRPHCLPCHKYMTPTRGAQEKSSLI